MISSLKLPVRLEPRRPGALAVVGVAFVYWVSAVVGSRLVVTADGVSLLWAPNAILLAALVRYQGRGWTAFAAAAIVAELAADLPRFPVAEALVFGCANVVEASVAWLLLQRWRFDARLHEVGDVGRFVLAAPLAGALIGASVGTLFLALVGAAPRPVDTLFTWWFGDALGLLLFTPLYLSVWTPPPATPRLRSRPAVDATLAIGGIVACALVAFSGVSPVHVRPIVLLPFVLYAAVRLPLWGACLAAMVASFLVVGLTVAGRSPYGTADPDVAAVLAQEFVLATSIVALGLSALLASVRLGEARTLRTNEALQRQAGVLAQSNAELRRIAFVAAHDLQTPLRSVSRFSQLLAGAAGTQPDVQDWARRVTDNAARLEAMLQDLGRLAAVDTSPQRLVDVPMDTLLDEVVRDLRGTLGAAGAVVRHDALPVVRGDREQLARLLRELLCNAVKFRSVAPPEIHVSARPERGEWVFAVRDNGVGIPPEEQDRVFELFYRPEGARGLPGTGFGLALCARIVHRHEGRVCLESTPGVGSTFYFSLPRVEPA